MASKQRVVRFKEGTVPVKGKAQVRSVQQIMTEASESSADAVAKTLKEVELLALIDYGGAADEVRKASVANTKLAKEILLVAATGSKWKTKSGAEIVAKVSPSMSTSILPRKMVNLLAKLKKQKLFDALFSVKVGEVKKYLGEDVIESIAKVDTEAFGSISFKRLKKIKT